MRGLRPDSGPRRVAGSTIQDHREQAGGPRDRALLPPALRFLRRAGGVAGYPRGLASTRPELLEGLGGRGPPGSGHHPRPGLGNRPAGGRPGAWQAHLRLVRGRDRLPVGIQGVGAAPGRARGVAPVVGGRGCPIRLLHREGQHPVPHHHLAGDAARLRRAEPAHRRARQPVRDLQGRQGVGQPRRGPHHRRGPGPVPGRRAPLRPGRLPARAERHGPLGRRDWPADQRGARRHLGKPGQPGALDGPQNL